MANKVCASFDEAIADIPNGASIAIESWGIAATAQNLIDITPEGLLLRKVAPGWIVQEVQVHAEPRLLVAEDIKEIEL